MTRHYFSAFGVVFFLSLAGVSAGGGEFIISYWWGPPPGADLDERYAEVAGCNFTHATIPAGASATVAQNKAILDACAKNGLKYIVHDQRVLKFGPDDERFTGNLDEILADYAAHPATAGYHIADEPGPGAFPLLGAVHRYLRRKAPQHLPWINLYPNHAPEDALGGTYENHVETFLTTVTPALLCFDHYGLMNDGTERPIYFENLEIIRRQGLKHATPFGFIFQLTPHGPYRDTSEVDLRWQIHTALAYGAKALFYFTYWTPAADGANTFRNGIIEQDGQRTAHYDMARRINAEIRNWAPTLVKLTSREVYHTGTIPTGSRGPGDDDLVKVTGDASLVVATFSHEDTTQWLMVVNRDLHQAASATLHLPEKVQRLTELSAGNGSLSPVAVEGPRVSIELPAAGAKLWQLGL